MTVGSTDAPPALGLLDVKKLSGIALAFLVLAIGGLLIAPGFMDWTRFKAPLAKALEDACGRSVTLGGEVRLTLLPAPTLSAETIAIANPPGATQPQLLRLGRLDARVALLPLLSGRIEIETIALDHPTLVLETLPDGRRAWLPEAAAAAAALPPELRLDRVDINDGTVLWQDDASGTTLPVTAIKARIGAASLAGPVELRGTAVIKNQTVSLEIATGNAGSTASTPLRLALGLVDGSASLHFAGVETPGPALRGDLRIEARHAAETAALLATAFGVPETQADLPAALGQPLAATAALEASTRGVTLAGLELRLGAATATGSARLTPGTPPALELRLATTRLDLRPWVEDVTLESAARLPERRRPFDASVRLDLAVDALDIGRCVLRQTRLAARLADGRLTVERLSVEGPGGSELVIAGTLDQGSHGRPTADATLEADTDNLRMLLEQLQIDAGPVPADRLRRASVVARVRGGLDDFQITGADLRIDTTRITGGLAYRNTGRPSMGVRLDVDHLDLDAYRGDGSRVLTAERRDVSRHALAALLGRGDINFQGHLGHLILDGLPVRDLDLDVTADHGALTIRSARVAEISGVAARVQGRLGGLDPLVGADLDFGAEVGSAAALERLSHRSLPASLHRLGAFKLAGHVAGDGQRLKLAVTADSPNGSLQATGTLAPLEVRLTDPLTLHAVFPETGRIIRLFDPDYRSESGLEPGVTDIAVDVTGDADHVHLSALHGKVAGITVDGRIDADLSGLRPMVEVRLKTGEILLQNLMKTSGPPPARRWLNLWPAAPPQQARRWSVSPLDLAWLGAGDGHMALDAAGVTFQGRRLGSLVLRATAQGGTLSLEQLDGELMQGRFGARGRFAVLPPSGMGSGTPVDAALTVTLVGGRIERGLLYDGSAPGYLDVIAGTFDLDMDLRSKGDSEMALAGGLAGTGRIAIRGGRLSGVDLPGLEQRLGAVHRPQDVVGLLTLGTDEAMGETPFDRLDAAIAVEHGIATIDNSRLMAPKGFGDAQGFIDLPNRLLNLVLRFGVVREPPLPTIGVTITGGFDHPRRNIDTRDLQSYVAKQISTAAPSQAAPGAVSPGGFLRNLFRDRSPTGKESP